MEDNQQVKPKKFHPAFQTLPVSINDKNTPTTISKGSVQAEIDSRTILLKKLSKSLNIYNNPIKCFEALKEKMKGLEEADQFRTGSVKAIFETASMAEEALKDINEKHLLGPETEAEKLHQKKKLHLEDVPINMSIDDIKKALRASLDGFSNAEWMKDKNLKNRKRASVQIHMASHTAYVEALNKKRIRLGCRTFNIREAVPRPLICTNCLKLGHLKYVCTPTEIICVKCGQKGHRAEKCKAANVRCANCKGNHSALSKQCGMLHRPSKPFFLITKSLTATNIDKKRVDEVLEGLGKKALEEVINGLKQNWKGRVEAGISKQKSYYCVKRNRDQENLKDPVFSPRKKQKEGEIIK